MILKAGTYRWIDKPDLSVPFSQDITFTVDLGAEFGVMEGNRIYNDYSSTTNELATGLTLSIGLEGDYAPVPIYAVATVEIDGGVGKGFIWYDSEDAFGGGIHYITITNDSDVSDTFGEIFIANTNYNEVNAKPLAEITYNGETIAQLNAGETATLSCKDKKMASDVVVKVDRVIIPKGDVTFNKNGSFDVANKATAIVDVKMPTPYRVNTFSDLPADAVDGSLAVVLRG